MNLFNRKKKEREEFTQFLKTASELMDEFFSKRRQAPEPVAVNVAIPSAPKEPEPLPPALLPKLFYVNVTSFPKNGDSDRDLKDREFTVVAIDAPGAVRLVMDRKEFADTDCHYEIRTGLQSGAVLSSK